MILFRTLSSALIGLFILTASAQTTPKATQVTNPPSHGLTHIILGGGDGGYQANSPWPRFRQNNCGTSVSAWGGCNGLQRWRTYLGSSTFFSSPAIAADGTIYIGTESGDLFALNSTGAINWSFPTKGPIWSSPAIGADGTVYIGSEDNSLYAVSPNGTKAWSYATGDQVVSSPAIDSNGVVYFGSWDRYVYAVNKDGSLKWKVPTGGPVLSSPVIGSDGTIYIGSNDYNLYAISASGTVNWKFPTKGPVQSSPSIGSDGTIYIGSASLDGDFYAVSPSGTKNWEVDGASLNPPLYGPILASPAIGLNGTIYIPCGDYILFINSTGAVNMWWGAAMMRGSPAVASDTSVTFPTNGDLMVWVNNGGGSFGYSGNFIWSSPAIGVDGTIYVGGGDGYFYAEGSQVNTIPVTGLSIAPSPIPGGQTATGTVTISEEPPVGAGDVVTLSSSTPAVASLVTPVTVQWNATSAAFLINTVPVQTDTSVTVYATSGGVTKSTAFVVKAPYPTALAVSPTSVQGSSNTTVEGQVTLSGAAPHGGVVVSLSSSNTNAATVPSTVSIPPGQTKGTFIVSHSKVSSQTSVTLTATLNGVSATATLTVTAG